MLQVNDHYDSNWYTFWNFTALPDEDFPLGIVVGVVGAVVAGAIIIGIVFLIRRRRNG